VSKDWGCWCVVGCGGQGLCCPVCAVGWISGWAPGAASRRPRANHRVGQQVQEGTGVGLRASTSRSRTRPHESISSSGHNRVDGRYARPTAWEPYSAGQACPPRGAGRPRRGEPSMGRQPPPVTQVPAQGKRYLSAQRGRIGDRRPPVAAARRGPRPQRPVVRSKATACRSLQDAMKLIAETDLKVPGGPEPARQSAALLVLRR